MWTVSGLHNRGKKEGVDTMFHKTSRVQLSPAVGTAMTLIPLIQPPEQEWIAWFANNCGWHARE